MAARFAKGVPVCAVQLYLANGKGRRIDSIDDNPRASPGETENHESGTRVSL